MDNWYLDWSMDKRNKMIDDRIQNGRKYIFSNPNGLPKKPDEVKGNKEALWYGGPDNKDYVVKVTKVNDNTYRVSEYIWQGNPISSTDDAYEKLTQTIFLEDIIEQGVSEKELMNNPILVFQWAAKIGINKMDNGAEQDFVYHLEQ